MTLVYLALGSNVGQRLETLQKAIALLHQRGISVRKISSIWETEPVGFASQGWFLNIVIEASTNMSPLDLLKCTAMIEGILGRTRKIMNGPRTIDIDILLHGDTILDSPTLTLPHPRMAERRFVLEPLAEIAPQLHHPVQKKSVVELLEQSPALAMRLVSKWKEPTEVSP